jgi:glutathione peroxidase
MLKIWFPWSPATMPPITYLLATSLCFLSILDPFTARALPSSEHDAHTQVTPRSPLYRITATDLYGNDFPMEQLQGKVVLFVNTASQCGFTGQYDGLEKLWQKYQQSDYADDFLIIGVPSNDFGGQEPGEDQEILQFCQINYGVTFPMLSKMTIKGNRQHMLYTFLTNDTDPATKVSWNFNKYLVGRDGRVIKHFGSMTKPTSKSVISAIDQAL